MEKWLHSSLLIGGLNAGPEDEQETKFLRDFIALQPGPGAELHRKMSRSHLSASAAQLSSIASISGNSLLAPWGITS